MTVKASVTKKGEMLLGVVCFLVFIVIGYFAFFDKIDTDNQTEAHFFEYERAKSGSVPTFRYHVNGVEYKQYSARRYGLFRGEVYRCYYNSSNPQKSYIDLSEPIFLDNESTGITNATITKFEERKKEYFVSFEYYVNSIKYTRWQTMKKTGNEAINAHVGDMIDIEYWLDDPRRAIVNNIWPR